VRILDSHVHLKHGDMARTEYAPEEILDVMDRAGIEQSVVFAMSTTTVRSIDMAEAAVEKFPDRLIPYVYALPSYERPVLREIEDALVNRNFKGVKIHEGECRLCEYIVDPVVALAGRCGAPCLIDFIGDYRTAERLVASFPDTTIIIAHMGQYLCTNGALLERFIALAESNPNAVMDVSGVVSLWAIEEAVRRLGSKRLLFGTDGPHPRPTLSAMALREINKIRMLDLAEQDRANILGLNMIRILKLDDAAS